ncbi:MAG: hypothetical protein NXI31_27175 [bacterium]|nr:hypothetical protein [bacterium]
MRLWPRSLWARLLCTLGLAIVGLVVLDAAVRAADAEAAPRRRAALFAAPALPPPVRLAAVQGPLLLGSSRARVPADAAPVIQVFADGGYALRRPSPVPSGPAAARTAAAILLPTRDFAALDSRARATFVEILGALVVERPVPPGRFVTIDLQVAQADLGSVLAWVR